MHGDAREAQQGVDALGPEEREEVEGRLEAVGRLHQQHVGEARRRVAQRNDGQVEEGQRGGVVVRGRVQQREQQERRGRGGEGEGEEGEGVAPERQHGLGEAGASGKAQRRQQRGHGEEMRGGVETALATLCEPHEVKARLQAAPRTLGGPARPLAQHRAAQDKQPRLAGGVEQGAQPVDNRQQHRAQHEGHAVGADPASRHCVQRRRRRARERGRVAV